MLAFMWNVRSSNEISCVTFKLIASKICVSSLIARLTVTTVKALVDRKSIDRKIEMIRPP